jgi:D-alanyl-D-alanine dipeptidase
MCCRHSIYIGIFSLLITALLGCENQVADNACEEDFSVYESAMEEVLSDSLKHLPQEENTIEFSCPLEDYIVEMGLVDIQTVDSTIMVDLRYASTNNFLGLNLYGCLSRAYLQADVAKRLAKAQHYLNTQYPNLRLYVFDAVRPLNVQQKMWEALDSIPVNERIKFVSNPKNGSIHNYGAAVDLSIYDTEKDTLLDMGAGFDDMRKIAYPKWEDKFLETGELTKKHIQNRKLLREVMRNGGFWVLPTEWWHFNAVSRDRAKELYEILDFISD